MRQGDGSDVLGPGDPRNSDIGILYVEARDSRQEILTALNTQEVQGRKQIAIVLSEQGKAFRHPLDFDGLKSIRRQLKAQLIFIVPSGRGPAELARQRHFAVYSSLDTFKTALLTEGIPTTNPRVKSQPGTTKRPGILDFGKHKAGTTRQSVPTTPKLINPAPLTPRLRGRSTPPTPRLHDQSAPPTPRLRDQSAPPTPRLHTQPEPLIMPQILPTPYTQGSSIQEETGKQAMPSMSPTPRVHRLPTAQSVPPTPSHPESGQPDQRDMGNMPPTPHLPDQHAQTGTPVAPPTPQWPNRWEIPTPRINEMHVAENTPVENAPRIPDSEASTNQGAPAANNLFTDERIVAAAAGMLAASSLESDDDALYAPPAAQSQQGEAPDQSNTPPVDPLKEHTPGEPPAKLAQENRPAPGIIAFPSMSTTPKAIDKDRPDPEAANQHSDDKLSAPQDSAAPNATPDTTHPRRSGIFPAAPGALPRATSLPDANPSGSRKLPAAQRPTSANAAPGPTRAPGNGAPGPGNTGKFAAPGTQSAGMNFGSTGKFAALDAAGMAGHAGAVSGTPGGPGFPPAQPVQRGAVFASAPAANQPGVQAPAAPWGASRFGGSSMSPRPSGLTPLPPPYSRRARRKRNRTLLLLFLLFLLCALTVVGVFAQHSQMPGLPGDLSATVTLTPASKLVTDNYLLSALPTGTPDPAHLQIAARLLTQNSGTSKATANATGSVAAKAATGTLVFFNSTSSGITLGSTTFTGKDGVQIRFNGPVFVPATGSASASAAGYALNPGARGNIPAFDIGGPCCASGISVKNTSPFSGGQDAQQNNVVQQSDLDNMARPLISKLTESTGAALQKQVRNGERIIDNTFQCKPTITSDHKVGDVVKTAEVQVTATCTEEVYDSVAARQIATSRLQSRASNDPALGSQYALDGQIVTHVLSNTVVSGSGQATIEVQAQGLWVYQFTSQMQQSIKQSLLRLSQADAQGMLMHKMGVASAQISIPGGSSLPANANAITLVIQPLPKPQSSPDNASGGSGSPTVIPSGTGIPAGPALTPTLTPVPGLGEARLY